MGGKLEVLARSTGEPVASELRGTFIVSSLATIRLRGLEAQYFAQLPAEHHAAVRDAVAQAWIAMDVAVAHYHAMEAVFPVAAEQISNGRLAAERTQNVHIRTTLRVLQATGVLQVRDALRRVPAFVVGRSTRGGTCVAYGAEGCKDARIELTGFPIFAATYTHNSCQGTFDGALAMLAKHIFVRQDLSFRGKDRMALLVSWV